MAKVRSKFITNGDIRLEDLAAEVTDAIATGGGAPVGTVFDYAGGTLPDGYLPCDGSAISRTVYSTLFTKIGTTYGAGDGSTTFNLPDLRGRATIGDGTGAGLSARTRGQAVGTETHILTSSEMPSHTHVQNAHAHTMGAPQGTLGGQYGIVDSGNSGSSGYGIVQSATATNQNTGGDTAHNNMQPSLVVKKIIKY